MTRYTRSKVRSSSSSKFKSDGKNYSQSQHRNLGGGNSKGYSGSSKSRKGYESDWIANDVRYMNGGTSSSTSNSSNVTVSSSFGISYFAIIVVLCLMLGFSSILTEKNKSNWDTCISIADCVEQYGKDFKLTLEVCSSFNSSLYEDNENVYWKTFKYFITYNPSIKDEINASKTMTVNEKNVQSRLNGFLAFLIGFTLSFVRFIFNIIGIIF